MKLAEALILRADCQKRVEQLKARLIRNARVQEGDAPAEQPAELIAELERVAGDLAGLIRRINKTNSAARFNGGLSISDALAARDSVALRRSVYSDLASAASVSHDRYSRSEVKFKSTVDVADLRRRADQFAKEYREMDSRIQEANWTIELIE